MWSEDATVITAAAVQRGPQGTYVYVVDADKKAHIRPITHENNRRQRCLRGTGLKPGELVVVEGTDKVQDGASVDLRLQARIRHGLGSKRCSRGSRGGDGGQRRPGTRQEVRP